MAKTVKAVYAQDVIEILRSDKTKHIVVYTDDGAKTIEYYRKDQITLIRCKDCFWHINIRLKKDGTPDNRYKPTYCGFHQIETKEDDYCSFATKPEKENETQANI